MKVSHITDKQVGDIEQSSGNAEQLARKLFVLIFRDALEERPNSVCCTESDGKELLDQEYLHGIRCRFVYNITGIG